jgi:ribosome-associated protein
MEFSLEGKENIELNRLIKYLKWAVSGGEANQFISNGLIKVNQAKEFRRRFKIVPGAVVSFEGKSCTVTE